MVSKGNLRTLFIRTLLALVGVLFLVFAFYAVKSGFAEHSRLKRLESEGRIVAGTIIRIDIDKQHPLNPSGGVDRTSWEYFHMATVQYTWRDETYVSDIRHYLTGEYENAQVGDIYPLLILPDEPEKSYAPELIAGSIFGVFATPVMLLLGAALCGFGAWYEPIWKK